MSALLPQDDDLKESIFRAAYRKDEDLFDTLMSETPDLANYALLVACQYGFFRSIQKLLQELGADVNTFDANRGDTPLHRIMEFNAESSELRETREQVAIVRYLVDHGADIEAQRRKFRIGQTPLMSAAVHIQFHAVKYLVDIGANVNAEAQNGETALIDAARNSDERIVRYLVEHGAHVLYSGRKPASEYARYPAIRQYLRSLEEHQRAAATEPVFRRLPQDIVNTISGFFGGKSPALKGRARRNPRRSRALRKRSKRSRRAKTR